MDYLFPDSALIIFCKAPVVGQVKTRLQPALTAEQAVAAHCQLTRMTMERAFRLPLCAVHLYCAPDIDHPFFQQCAKDYPLTLLQQRGCDLGQRMRQAFAETLASYRHAILIGCDCPSLAADDLRQALTALKQGKDLVIAPAEDGGYVLIGLSAPQPLLFENMVWGIENVMTETRRRAADANLTVYELNTQWDVDNIDGWNRFLGEERLQVSRKSIQVQTREPQHSTEL